MNGKKVTYKIFLHKVAVLWIADSSTDSEIDEEADLHNISNTSEPTRRAPRFDHPQRHKES
jgi:hypothetical protein